MNILIQSMTPNGKMSQRMWALKNLMATAKPNWSPETKVNKTLNSDPFRRYLIMCMCVPVCRYMHMSIGAWQGQVLDPPELELVTLIGAGNWILVPWKSSIYSYPLSSLSSPLVNLEKLRNHHRKIKLADRKLITVPIWFLVFILWEAIRGK